MKEDIILYDGSTLPINEKTSIAYDHYNEIFVKKSKSFALIVDVHEGKPVILYFSNDMQRFIYEEYKELNALYSNYLYTRGYDLFNYSILPVYGDEYLDHCAYALNMKVIEKLKAIYIGSNGWATPEYANRIKVNEFIDKKGPKNKNIGLSYSSTRLGIGRKLSYNLGLESPSYRGTFGLKYNFGVELETSSGTVYSNMLIGNELNVKGVHDGSVKGTEFVTGVLKGDTGMLQLYKLTKVLNKYTCIDKTCGVHVHIGGAIFNKSFNVYAYILGRKLEDSIFSMLPKSRKTNRFCGTLPNLKLEKILKKYGFKYGVEVAYDVLYRAMTYGEAPSAERNKNQPHKFGRYCGQYNGIDNKNNLRYKWLNFIPCNFKVRSSDAVDLNSKTHDQKIHTLEFRNHSATLNYFKIKNWILICMAFVNYVENYKDSIINNKNITVPMILKKVYGEENSKPLIKYYNERVKKFSKEEAEKSEYKTGEIPSKSIKDLLCVL